MMYLCSETLSQVTISFYLFQEKYTGFLNADTSSIFPIKFDGFNSNLLLQV